MNTMLKTYLLSCMLLFVFSSVSSQSFDYTFTKTTGTYQSLSGSIVLDSGANWNNKQYRISLGFSFNYMSHSFDSLTVATNGFLVFDDEQEYAFTAFKGMQCKKDTDNVYSVLSYQLSGAAGARILKIEYKNCGLYPSYEEELFNYQVWFYEQSGKVEVHTGTHDYTGIPTIYEPMIGLINMNCGTGTFAFLLDGNPSSPSAQALNSNANLISLTGLPAQGTVYTFTPNN